MVARVATVAFQGIEAVPVEVQVTIAAGLPAFTVVGLPDKAVTAEAMAQMVNYHWPGNIRELINCIEHAITLSTGPAIDTDVLPPRVRQAGVVTKDLEGFAVTLEELERQYVLQTLDRVDSDKVRAAQILGIDLSTLYRKLKRYGKD